MRQTGRQADEMIAPFACNVQRFEMYWQSQHNEHVEPTNSHEPQMDWRRDSCRNKSDRAQEGERKHISQIRWNR